MLTTWKLNGGLNMEKAFVDSREAGLYVYWARVHSMGLVHVKTTLFK